MKKYLQNTSENDHIMSVTQCTHTVKINTPKIGKTLKLGIKLSELKFMYLGYMASDLRDLVSNFKFRAFSIETKK